MIMTYNDIINEISHVGADIVFTDLASKIINADTTGANFHKMTDARDAVFFTLGLNDISKSSPCCALTGNEIGSAYTGLVEALMRNKRVIILVIEQDKEDVSYRFLDNYDIKIIRDYELTSINDIYSIKKPIVIRCKGNNEKKSLPFKHATVQLLDSILPKEYVFAGNDIGHYSLKRKCIDMGSNSYGVLSRYVGMTQAEDNIILIINETNLKVDLNILNTRYKSSRIKIILVGDESLDITEWCQSNGINYGVYRENEEKTMTVFLLQSKAATVVRFE